MAETAGMTAGKAGGRWLRVALAVSVAINLAVAGVVAGAWLRDGPPRGGGVRDVGFGPYAAGLTDDDRAALRRALIARGPDLRAARAAMRDDMAAVVAALRAEPFDAEAMTAAMERGTARVAEFAGLGRLLLVDHAAAMTPEARAAFAERLESAANRRGPPGRPGP
jgi:uncharacterized membrane protein